jgi:hypothetical protein
MKQVGIYVGNLSNIWSWWAGFSKKVGRPGREGRTNHIFSSFRGWKLTNFLFWVFSSSRPPHFRLMSRSSSWPLNDGGGSTFDLVFIILGNIFKMWYLNTFMIDRRSLACQIDASFFLHRRLYFQIFRQHYIFDQMAWRLTLRSWSSWLRPAAASFGCVRGLEGFPKSRRFDFSHQRTVAALNADAPNGCRDRKSTFYGSWSREFLCASNISHKNGRVFVPLKTNQLQLIF